MKKQMFLGLTLAAAASLAVAACGPASPTGNHTGGANHAMNHNGMSSGNSMDHNSMMNANSGGMDHSKMVSDPGAAAAPYDLQFIDTMSAHHEGAVEMAKTALRRTANPELKAFAQKIIDDQKKEIAEMGTWREKWYPGKPRAMNMEMTGMADSMKTMNAGGMAKFEEAAGKEFDVMFVDMMTPHHAGAIIMAEEALKNAEHAEIKTLATDIIKAQKAEIEKMSAWKAAWNK